MIWHKMMICQEIITKASLIIEERKYRRNERLIYFSQYCKKLSLVHTSFFLPFLVNRTSSFFTDFHLCPHVPFSFCPKSSQMSFLLRSKKMLNTRCMCIVWIFLICSLTVRLWCYVKKAEVTIICVSSSETLYSVVYLLFLINS